MRKTIRLILLVFAIGNVAAFAQTSTSSVAYTTRDRGGMVVETAGGTGALIVGYGRVQPSSSTTPAGVAIFGLRQNGVLVSEAGVAGLFTMVAGRTYAEVNGPTNTGVAFANTTAAPIVVTFNFTDQNGTDLAQGNFTMAANTQITKFVTESPFSIGGSFSGTLTFNATAPVAVLALRTLINERGEFLMTTQPVTPLPESISASPFAMAHFAYGGGWKTSVILVNSTDFALSGSVQFFNEGTATVAGQPITLSVNGQTAASFNYTVRARSSVKLETTAPVGAALQVGSVQVTPSSGSNSPAGFAVFSQTNNGATVSQATVQVQQPGNAFRTYVEVTSRVPQTGQIQSAVAISNSSSTAATVNFELPSLDGTATGLNASVLVPASGHVSRFVHELFPTVSLPFRGILRVSTGGQVSIVSERTRYNERLDLLITTMPVTNEASQSTSADMLFPVVADGSGYSTQFILFSGIAGQSTTGNLRFFAPNGQPMNVNIR
jgi:hypothetical protein